MINSSVSSYLSCTEYGKGKSKEANVSFMTNTQENFLVSSDGV